jgi:hypothetical protein
LLHNKLGAYVLLQGATTVLIWLCDAVLQEAKVVFVLTRRFRYSADIKMQKMEKFLWAVTNNCPRFSAAGFFFIDRSLILKILSVIFGFFDRYDSIERTRKIQ